MADESLIIDEQAIRVRDGELANGASWVYVWLQGAEVVHVGATALPPAARTWLHLHHDDPKIGRVRAERPDALSGDVTVRAFRLGPALDRHEVKEALITLLEGGTSSNEAAAAIVARVANRSG